MNLFLACTTGFFIAAGVAGLGLLITIHELGHFVFCKIFNVKTPSFSIGFGPRVFTKRLWDTDFSLSLIPLGGYVEIEGIGEDSEEKTHPSKYSFFKKSYYQKLLIILGGILTNIVFAYVALSFLFLIGMKQAPIAWPLQKVIVKEVEINSAASSAGIQPGDVITALVFEQGKAQGSMLQILEAIRTHPSQRVTIHLERNGSLKTVTTTIGSTQDAQPIGKLGIALDRPEIKPHNPITALIKGISLTHSYLKEIAQLTLSKFKTREHIELVGPVRIVSNMVASAAAGFGDYLLLLAIISLSLALINVVPVLPFDGGQLLIVTVEAASGKSLPLRIREIINLISWAILIPLFIYVTFCDIRCLVGLWAKK